MERSGPVTDLLVHWASGNEKALEELAPLVYGELRRLARFQMARERGNHTLQPTALAHEAFLRLCDQNRIQWQSRVHFFALAAEMMRRVLVEHARKRRAAKRGGGATAVTLDEKIHGRTPASDVDVLDLNEALESLEAVDPRQARIVELRYFGGLSVAEAAQAMSLSPATIKREWEVARRFLYRELRR